MAEDPAANRRTQTQLYGAPLAEIIDQIGTALGLTQGRIAEVLGLSAPMLSHLVSGRRVKVAHPLANSRLVQLRSLADEVLAGAVPADAVGPAIEQIATVTDTWSTRRLTPVSDPAPTAPGAPGAPPVRVVQELFRAVADSADYLEAAQRLQDDLPEVAELLRVYGASRTARAEEHWRRVVGG